MGSDHTQSISPSASAQPCPVADSVITPKHGEIEVPKAEKLLMAKLGQEPKIPDFQHPVFYPPPTPAI